MIINNVSDGSCVTRGGTASYKKKLKSLYILTQKCPNKNARIEQLTEMLLSREEEKGLIVKDPFLLELLLIMLLWETLTHLGILDPMIRTWEGCRPSMDSRLILEWIKIVCSKIWFMLLLYPVCLIIATNADRDLSWFTVNRLLFALF